MFKLIIANSKNTMKISNYFFVSQRKLRRILLVLIIFSNFNLSRVYSENKIEDISEYKKNLFSCTIGFPSRYQLGMLSEKEIDQKINQCKKSLKEEKNLVRELFTRNLIAEYYGFYKSNNRYDEFFNLKKEKERISLYKKTLKLFEQLKLFKYLREIFLRTLLPIDFYEHQLN